MKTIHTKTLIKRKSSEISLELIYLAVEHLIHSLQQGRRAQPDPPRDAINSLCSSASPSKHFTFNPSLQNLTTQAGTAAGLAPRSAARAAPGVRRGKDDTFPHLTFLFPTGAWGGRGGGWTKTRVLGRVMSVSSSANPMAGSRRQRRD